jgi:hypothetical protein
MKIAVAIQSNTATNILTLSEPTINIPGVGIEIITNQPGKSFSVMLGFPQGFEVPQGQQVELSLKTSSPKVPAVKVPVKQMARPPTAVLPAPPAPTVAPAPNFPLVPPAALAAPGAPAGKVSSDAGSPTPPRPPLPPGL